MCWPPRIAGGSSYGGLITAGEPLGYEAQRLKPPTDTVIAMRFSAVALQVDRACPAAGRHEGGWAPLALYLLRKERLSPRVVADPQCQPILTRFTQILTTARRHELDLRLTWSQRQRIEQLGFCRKALALLAREFQGTIVELGRAG